MPKFLFSCVPWSRKGERWCISCDQPAHNRSSECVLVRLLGYSATNLAVNVSHMSLDTENLGDFKEQIILVDKFKNMKMGSTDQLSGTRFAQV